MALGSQLLKHFVVSSCCRLPWRDTPITRNERTKPVYRDPATGKCPLDFNVSHQAGLVALVAVHGRGTTAPGRVDVGVDVVSTSERRDRDHAMVRADGWLRFVDMHADVFADSEAAYLKHQILSSVPGLRRGADQEEILDFKLRCFYTLWCLREAYIKMTGDALLAKWLKNLEFRHFVPPAPTASFYAAPREDGSSQVTVSRSDLLFYRQPVTDANVHIQSMGPDIMCCTAVRTTPDAEEGLSYKLGSFRMLSIDEILRFAESTL